MWLGAAKKNLFGRVTALYFKPDGMVPLKQALPKVWDELKELRGEVHDLRQDIARLKAMVSERDKELEYYKLLERTTSLHVTVPSDTGAKEVKIESAREYFAKGGKVSDRSTYRAGEQASESLVRQHNDGVISVAILSAAESPVDTRICGSSSTRASSSDFISGCSSSSSSSDSSSSSSGSDY